MKSIVAPTHNAIFASIASLCRWTHNSCFGAPSPTTNTSGRAAATADRIRLFSLGFRSKPSGGLSRPTTCTPRHAVPPSAPRATDFRTRSQQEHAYGTLRLASIEELRHKITAGDPFGECAAEQPG